jgi:hypothetical protein
VNSASRQFSAATGKSRNNCARSKRRLLSFAPKTKKPRQFPGGASLGRQVAALPPAPDPAAEACREQALGAPIGARSPSASPMPNVVACFAIGLAAGQGSRPKAVPATTPGRRCPLRPGGNNQRASVTQAF